MARNRHHTSGKIRMAAAKLLTVHGFESWGVNAVARQAGVDKVLIYRYFGSTDGLLASIIDNTAFWPDPDEMDTGSAEAFLQETLDFLKIDGLWSLLLTLPEGHSCQQAVVNKSARDLENWLDGIRRNTTGMISDKELLKLPALLQFAVLRQRDEITSHTIWSQVSPPLEWLSTKGFQGFEELPTELL